MNISGKAIVLALSAVAACAVLFVDTAAAGPANQTRTEHGIVVHLGIKLASVIKAQPGNYPELHGQGRIPDGRNDHYLLVALFDSATGERITGARVSSRVSPLGLAGSERDLEPVLIAGVVTYGNFFKLSASDTYVIGVEIRLPDGAAMSTKFQYRPPSRDR
jgi:hypothetical protein